MRSNISIATLVVCSVFAAASMTAQPAAKLVTVCGAEKSKSTHIIVHRGERWAFEVVGSSPSCEDGEHGDPRLTECDRPACARWADGKRLDPVDADGWERCLVRPFFFLKRVRSAHWYELTGAVGNPFQQTFAIGREETVKMESDGELFLFANDASWRYRNNRGSLHVRITRAE